MFISAKTDYVHFTDFFCITVLQLVRCIKLTTVQNDVKGKGDATFTNQRRTELVDMDIYKLALVSGISKMPKIRKICIKLWLPVTSALT